MQILPWQQEQWQSMMQRIASNKMAHAIIYTGPEGVGKTNFAHAFVHRLFCKRPVNNQACGCCDACHLLNINHHPDLKLIAPAEGKQIISIDQIRELIEYQNLTPHSAPKKVAVIEHAEMLNVNASNSLLKTLEEPPASSLLILLTHHPDRLLPTIRSRCQRVEFTSPDFQQALMWLMPQVNNDQSLATSLLALASNAPLKALSYAANNMIDQRNTIFESMQGLNQGKLNPVTVAASWLKQDFEIMHYCMVSWVIDMIRLKASNDPPILGNPDLKQTLRKMSESIDLRGLLNYYETLNKTVQWKRSNINAQMILEDILIQWVKISRYGNKAIT